MLARYFLFPVESEWIVTLEGRVMTRCATRTEAIEAAVIMADLMGAMHHDADVMKLEAGSLDLIWTYGQDKVSGRKRKSTNSQTPRRVVQVQTAASVP
jgi:hypothetical protein